MLPQGEQTERRGETDTKRWKVEVSLSCSLFTTLPFNSTLIYSLFSANTTIAIQQQQQDGGRHPVLLLLFTLLSIPRAHYSSHSHSRTPLPMPFKAAGYRSLLPFFCSLVYCIIQPPPISNNNDNQQRVAGILQEMSSKLSLSPFLFLQAPVVSMLAACMLVVVHPIFVAILFVMQISKKKSRVYLESEEDEKW